MIAKCFLFGFHTISWDFESFHLSKLSLLGAPRDFPKPRSKNKAQLKTCSGRSVVKGSWRPWSPDNVWVGRWFACRKGGLKGGFENVDHNFRLNQQKKGSALKQLKMLRPLSLQKFILRPTLTDMASRPLNPKRKNPKEKKTQKRKIITCGLVRAVKGLFGFSG